MALVDEARVDTGDPVRRAALVRPLRLDDLPPSLRPVAMASIVGIFGWCLALGLTAVGSGVQFDPRGFAGGLMGSGGVGPAFVRITTAVSFATVLATATVAIWTAGWADGGWSRLGRRLVRIAVVAVGLRFLGDVAVHGGTLQPAPGETRGDTARLIWSSGLGWSAMVVVAASLFLPRSGALVRRLAIPLAVLPVGAWLVAELVKGSLTTPWESNAERRSDLLLGTVDSLQLMLILFLVWEIVTWTELAADGAAFVARHLPDRRLTVVALLAVKAIWVSAGLAGVLPGFLGGNAAVWRKSLDDGVASWLLGGALAVLAVLATSRQGRLAKKAELAWRPLLIVLLVLVGPGVLAGVVDVLSGPLTDLIPQGVVDLAQMVVVLVAAAVVALAIVAADTSHAGVGGDARDVPDVPDAPDVPDVPDVPDAPDEPDVADVPGPPDPRSTPRLLDRRTLLLVAVDICLLLGFFAAALQVHSDRAVLVRIEERLPFPEPPYFWLWDAPGQLTAQYFVAPGVAFAVAVVLTIRSRRARSQREGRGSSGERAESAWAVPASFAVTLAAIAILYVLPHLPQLPLQSDPDLVGATGDLLEPLLSPAAYPLAPAGWTAGWNGVPGTFEPATFDAVLTVGLCILAGRWWRSHDRWRLLSFVLLVSTVLAYSSTVRPDGWLGNHWYYAGLVVPVVWQLVVRGDELNRLVRRHPPLAVLNLALILLLLTVLGYRLLTGALDPTVEFEDAAFPYGRGVTLTLVLVPLGVVAVSRHLSGRST